MKVRIVAPDITCSCRVGDDALDSRKRVVLNLLEAVAQDERDGKDTERKPKVQRQ